MCSEMDFYGVPPMSDTKGKVRPSLSPLETPVVFTAVATRLKHRMTVAPGYVWAVTCSCQEGIAFVRLYAVHGTFDRRVIPCHPFLLMDLWRHGDAR